MFCSGKRLRLPLHPHTHCTGQGRVQESNPPLAPSTNDWSLNFQNLTSEPATMPVLQSQVLACPSVLQANNEHLFPPPTPMPSLYLNLFLQNQVSPSGHWMVGFCMDSVTNISPSGWGKKRDVKCGLLIAVILVPLGHLSGNFDRLLPFRSAVTVWFPGITQEPDQELATQ